MAVEPSGVSRDGTRETALVGAYLDGNMSRRTFVRRLLAAGVSLSAAVAYTHALKPSPARATHGGHDHYDVPTVLTLAATELHERKATLNGQVNPAGVEADAWFEYGPTAAYGQKTTEQKVAASDDPVGFAQKITGLERSTTYHFRLVARNKNGVVEGAGSTFTTPDTTAPKLAIEPVDTKLKRVWRKRRLRVSVTSDEAASLRLKAKMRKRLRPDSSGKPRFKQIVVAKGSGSIAGPGSRRVALELTRAGRKMLKGRSSAKLNLIVAAHDAAGNRRKVARQITLG